LLVATPVYGWYGGLLVALVAMSGALEWLPVALAPTLIYLVQGEFGRNPAMARLGYLAAAALAAAGYLLRRRFALPVGPPAREPEPELIFLRGYEP